MLPQFLRGLLAPPPLDNETSRRQALYLTVILWVSLGLSSLNLLLIPLSRTPILLDISIFLTEAGLCVGLLALLKRGRVGLAGGIYLATLWALTFYMMIGTGGVRTPVYTSFLLVLSFGSILFGWQVGLGIALLSAIASFPVYRSEVTGGLEGVFIPLSPLAAWGIGALMFVMAAGVYFLYERSMKRALREAQQAEASLRRQERALRALLDNLPDLVWQKDTDARFVLVNSRFAEEAGLPIGQIIGKTDAEIWPSYPHRYLYDDRQVIAEQASRRSVEAISTSDGQEAWMEAIKSPVFNEQQEVIGSVGVARDISDRRKTEKALAESEEKYRLLFSTARDAIVIVDAETRRIVDVNAMASRTYGYTREELLGMSAPALSAEPEASGQHIAAIGSLAPLEIDLDLRWHRKKDGTVFPVELSVGQVTIGGRRLIIGNFRDITERMDYEVALRESESRFRGLVEQSPIATILYDLSGKPTLANNAAVKMARITPNAAAPGQVATGRVEANIFHDPSLKREGLGHLVRRAFQGAYVEFPPVSYAENQWLQTAMYPVRDNSGDIREIVVMHQNVTQRVLAEEALRASELFLRQLVEDQTELLVRWLPDGTRTFINESYCRFFGRQREEILHTDLYPMLSETDQAHVRAKIASLTPQNPTKTSEYQLRRHDGALRWTQWNTRAFFDEDGNLRELLSVGQDVTERHEAAERQEASLQEKEVLLKEIHHRVKNNLQIVSSLLKLQGRHVADEQTQMALLESRNRINSMALIHEKLYQSSDLARIDFAAYTRDITYDILRSFAPRATRIRADVRIRDVDLNIELAIPCALILNELISNALKHAFPAGRPGRIEIRMERQGSEYLLTVQDNGIGLPADRDIFAGDSLGLQLVHTLADQLGGRLTLESDPGLKASLRFPTPYP